MSNLTYQEMEKLRLDRKLEYILKIDFTPHYYDVYKQMNIDHFPYSFVIAENLLNKTQSLKLEEE